MIVFSRAVARSFRNVLRRSVMAASPRGPAPPVLAIAGPEGLTLRAVLGKVGLTLRLNTKDAGSGQIVFPGELLKRIEGSGTEQVVLEILPSDKGQARWEERGVPNVADFDPVEAAKTPALPPMARRLTPMPATFLKTLDNACRTAGHESVRFGMDHVQLRGKTGQVVATNGRQLLIQGGLDFPFSTDVLVPALPVFGCKEWTEARPLALGRTDGRILIRAGSWCLDLQIDTESRFPNVDKVIPSNPHPTCLVIGAADALFLIDKLPALPAGDAEVAPVTVDLAEQALIRARGPSKATEVLLCDSQVTGSPARFSVDRQILLRVLRLGFRRLEVHASKQPLLARDGERLFVFVMLDANSVVGPSLDALRLTTTANPIAPVPPLPERNPAMNPSSNGNNGHHADPTEKLDPLVEAEAVKVALQEALNRSTRLIASLRQYRKQRKVVQSAMASLRQLQIAP